MTDIDPIDYHVRRAIFSLNPIFWGKPRIASVVRCLVEEVQELEDAAWSVMLLRMVDNAFMPQLEILGKIVGQPNFGFELETYRALVKCRVLVNRSNGTAPDLIGVVRVLHSGLLEWFVTSERVNVIVVENAGTLPQRALLIALSGAKQATARMVLYYAPELALRFDDAESVVAGYGVMGDAEDDLIGTPTFDADGVYNKDAL